jgi:hypothetical protein
MKASRKPVATAIIGQKFESRARSVSENKNGSGHWLLSELVFT